MSRLSALVPAGTPVHHPRITAGCFGGAEGGRFVGQNDALVCLPRLRQIRGATVGIMLPGAELIDCGVRDLDERVESVESLLVSIGAPRLRRLGLAVGQPFEHPEHRLYELLRGQYGDAAHSRYNALVRRLVSFERAFGRA